MSRVTGDKGLRITAILLSVLLSACSFSSDEGRPLGEYTFDLTERLKVISTHKPIRGYSIRGCWHSFQRGRGALEGEDVLYCYLCNRKKDKYIETQYPYRPPCKRYSMPYW